MTGGFFIEIRSKLKFFLTVAKWARYLRVKPLKTIAALPPTHPVPG
jgi:hypothetical protein